MLMYQSVCEINQTLTAKSANKRWFKQNGWFSDMTQLWCDGKILTKQNTNLQKEENIKCSNKNNKNKTVQQKIILISL